MFNLLRFYRLLVLRRSKKGSIHSKSNAFKAKKLDYGFPFGFKQFIFQPDNGVHATFVDDF